MMGNFENYLLVGDILFSVYNIGSRLLNKKEDNPQESSFSPPPPTSPMYRNYLQDSRRKSGLVSTWILPFKS